jgi:Glycosyltransferase
MKPRATFICGGTLVPASRFRVHPVEAALREQGWRTKLVHGYGSLDQKITHPLFRRAYRAMGRIQRAVRTGTMRIDGPVMVQRLAWPWYGAPEARLAERSDGLVFDFDDAVFLGESGRPSLGRRRALTRVFAASRHVVAGNSWLAAAIDADVPVTVLPTCIDTSVYAPPEERTCDAVPTIGWVGTGGNIPYLHQLVESVRKLRASGYKFKFHICSDVRPDRLLEELGATFTKWSAETELAFLQSLDVGLMPLEDNDWCRGKCSFKLIQYMAVGCPVVASDVGLNRDVVMDGQVGHLVRNSDWVSPLAYLLTEPDVRAEMGRAARHRAVAQFDSSVAVDAYRKILEGLQ